MINARYLLVMLAIVNLLITGCTSLQGFPYVARAGDTVALAIGSPDDMSRSNTTAVFISKGDPGYPGSPAEYPVTIRSIFKLYGDKASPLYQRNSEPKQIIDNSGHEAWVTIAAIDLPAPLPVGPGEIRFTSGATYPTIGSHINNLPIDIDIIAGTGGSAHTFPYEFGTGSYLLGDLTELEAKQHAVVFPTFSGAPGSWPQYGAIEINMDISATSNLLDRSLRVWLDDMTSASSSGRSMMYHVANGKDLKVIITSHRGALHYYESRLTIVLPGSVTFTTTPFITSVDYYDVNGNVATGPAIVDYTVEER